MKLRSFRVLGCFGFADSGDVALDPPGDVVFLLGRNSSGKTSFLQALRHLEVGLLPSEYKNFSNFNPISQAPLLIARFSVETKDLELAKFLGRFRKLLVQRGLPESALKEHPQVTALFGIIEDHYLSLLETLASAGEVFVQKDSNGNYYFLPKLGDSTAFNERRTKIARQLRELLPGGRFKGNNVDIPLSVTAEEIENDLFNEFSAIVFFGDSFRLGDDLPDRITSVTMAAAPKSEIEKAFLDFLGRETLARFFVANDPDERDSILGTLRARANLLGDSINRQAASLPAVPGLVGIVLHEKDGLQVTIKVDEKKSFYRQISENTKILIAYHLHSLARQIEGRVLLFDEPSTGFHPSAQTYLLEFFQSLAARGNQVILSTHSEYMINLDALAGVRLMASDKSGALKVENHPYRRARPKADFLALQPIRDAIGLRYGMGLSFNRNVVLTEGITDLLYLRSFNLLLGGVVEDLSVAPARSDAHLMTLLPFFVGQGIGIRVMIDTGGLRLKIQEEYGISDDFVFEVPVPKQFMDHFQASGIEDLFSKEDFKMLAETFDVDLGDGRSFDLTPNSNAMRKHIGKRLIAHQLLASVGRRERSFDDETKANFTSALIFCNGSTWFKL